MTDSHDPNVSPDGRWYWNGYQWIPRRQPFRMTAWRWAWIVWCCGWACIWIFAGVLFLPLWVMVPFSLALIAVIAVRTPSDDKPEDSAAP